MAGSNILTPGLSGGRQGVMKERIVEVRMVLSGYNNVDWASAFDDKVNALIKEGFQPMPNSIDYGSSGVTIVMMKTEMKVEMI